jgi:cytohesin
VVDLLVWKLATQLELGKEVAMEERQQETKDESSKTEESDIEEKSVEIGCRSDDLETVVLNEVFTAENDSKENLLEQIETPSEAESSQINPSKNPVDAEGEVIVANIPGNEANIDPKEEGKDEGESLQVEETKKEEIPFLVNRLEDLKVYNEDELQKLYLEAVIKFNIKPKSVRQFLISKKLIQGFPSEIAQFIQKNPKISKRRLGEYIGNPDEFQQLVCDELFKLYDFKNRTLDHALRLLLLQFRLPGEAQQIDRILEKFAQHYFLQNPNIFLSSDTAYVLSFSLIMLNTDLHNQSIIPEKKMTLDQFIKNNRGINQGKDIPSEILITLYNSVKENEIRMEETDMYESEVVAFMAPTKSGWLSKQTDNYLLEMSLWKRYWFVLNDGCLYYFTDPSDEGPTCIIPLDNTKPLKGKGSELDLILTSSVSGDHIKSSKVLADGRMEQGRHKQLLFRSDTHR